MFDIIDFVMENANQIQDYEVEYFSDHTICVTFTMKNGDTQIFYDSE